MNEDSNTLMTVDEAAAYLRLASWTLRHWVCKKKIPFVRLGRSVRFRRKDLERFVAQNLHGKLEDSRSAKPGSREPVTSTPLEA